MKIIDANTPHAKVQMFAPRTRQLKYSADHIDGRWIISTDWNAPNFRLMTVTEAQLGNRDARGKNWFPINQTCSSEGF